MKFFNFGCHMLPWRWDLGCWENPSPIATETFHSWTVDAVDASLRQPWRLVELEHWSMATTRIASISQGAGLCRGSVDHRGETGHNGQGAAWQIFVDVKKTTFSETSRHIRPHIFLYMWNKAGCQSWSNIDGSQKLDGGAVVELWIVLDGGSLASVGFTQPGND